VESHREKLAAAEAQGKEFLRQAEMRKKKIADLGSSDEHLKSLLGEQEAELALYRRRMQSAEEELEKLRPLRLEHLKRVMQRLTASIKLRKRVRGLVDLTRRSTVPDLANLRTRGLVIDEVTKTERQYARSLSCLERVFLSRVDVAAVFPEARGKEAFIAFRKVPRGVESRLTYVHIW